MLLSKLQDDLYAALKSGDSLCLSVLRLILSALNYEKISKQHELSDEEILAVINHEAKKHRESIASFKAGNRPDLVDKEEKELGIILSYLPKQLTEGEIQEEVKKILAEMTVENKSNFGQAMSLVMRRLKGKAEGTVIANIVRELSKVAA